MHRIAACLNIVFFLVPGVVRSGPLGLVLPTDNDAIFSSDPSAFYMYTDRNFEGVVTKPWSGGAYGFTRDQKRTSAGILLTRLHEGVDISPVRRDSSGEPLDEVDLLIEVRAISDGTVVHMNGIASQSNYGRYIVVHHDWGDGPFFSLYAHLGTASAKAGQRVAAGEAIGKLGYTGAGINRERAHVHLELNMILSDRFQLWYGRHFTSKNHHGIYNGINLTGLDIAGLLTAHKANPTISIPEFLAKHTEIHYKILVPKSGDLDVLRRYPWLGRDLDKVRDPQSWEFSFAATGIPLEIRPSKQSSAAPVVTYVKPSQANHADLTADRLTGTGSTATLTPTGARYVQLLSDSF